MHSLRLSSRIISLPSAFRMLSTESTFTYSHPSAADHMEIPTSSHVDFDVNTLWHPYTSMTQPIPTLPVASASGVRLNLETGESLVDGMSSWWCAVHGYNNERLNGAASHQLSKMSHVMFGGLTHRPAVALGRLLAEITPEPLSKVFLCDSGSISVEVAMKMALQYQRGIAPSRNKFLTVRGGYHGDTSAAMSVCDPVTGMHSAFKGALAEQIFSERPDLDEGGVQLERTVLENKESIAALIIEPCVQGAGGMRFYSPKFLVKARELCDEHGILLICDEIATGFGRAGGGEFWGTSLAVKDNGEKVVPDIMCVGKALTGGYMTLAAAIATEQVAKGVSRGDPALPLMHGPTFMANPLACSVALESIGLLLRDEGGTPWWKSRVGEINLGLTQQLEPARGLPGVADVRVQGAIGVVEMENPVDVPYVTKRCLELGAWLRPFGKNIYCMVPYVIEEDDLKVVTGAMVTLAKELDNDETKSNSK